MTEVGRVTFYPDTTAGGGSPGQGELKLALPAKHEIQLPEENNGSNKKKQESLTVSKIVQKCLKQLFLLITKFNFFADHQYLQSYLEIAKTKYILYNNNS